MHASRGISLRPDLVSEPEKLHNGATLPLHTQLTSSRCLAPLNAVDVCRLNADEEQDWGRVINSVGARCMEFVYKED